MASTTLFLIMAIVALILIIAAGVTSTIGASDIYNSVLYNSNSNAFTARQHLTIAAALSWSNLALLVVILIIMWVTGGFGSLEVSTDLLKKCYPTKCDLIAAYRGEKILQSIYTTEIVILIVLIVIGIIALVIGIEGVVAAVALGNIRNRDSFANTAYAEAIATAVIGFTTLIVMIIAVILYIGIRSARTKNLAEIQEFIERGEGIINIQPK